MFICKITKNYAASKLNNFMLSFSKFAEALELNKAKYFRNIAKDSDSDPSGYKDRGKRILLPDVIPFMSLDEIITSTDVVVTSLINRLTNTLVFAGYYTGNTFDQKAANFYENRCYPVKDEKPDLKNATKITRVLAAKASAAPGTVFEKLLKVYQHNTHRVEYEAMKKDKERGVQYRVLVSSLYLDVAGMSTDKKWTSCMNLGGKRIRSKNPNRHQSAGINSDYVDDDIREGTIVAYLIRTPYKSIDAAIDDAQARIAIRPHFDALNDGTICYVAGPVYGIKSQTFIDIVNKFVDSKNLSKVYIRNKRVYDDGALNPEYKTVDQLQSHLYALAQKDKDTAFDMLINHLSVFDDEYFFKNFAANFGTPELLNRIGSLKDAKQRALLGSKFLPMIYYDDVKGISGSGKDLIVELSKIMEFSENTARNIFYADESAFSDYMVRVLKPSQSKNTRLKAVLFLANPYNTHYLKNLDPKMIADAIKDNDEYADMLSKKSPVFADIDTSDLI